MIDQGTIIAELSPIILPIAREEIVAPVIPSTSQALVLLPCFTGNLIFHLAQICRKGHR
jgi:hypothetical protein